MIRCPFPFFVQPDIRSRERTTRCGGSVGLAGMNDLNPIRRIPWQRCSIYEVSRDPRLRSSSLAVRSSSAVSTPPSRRFARVGFWPQWHSKNVRCARQSSSQPRWTSASPRSAHQRMMRPKHSIKGPDPAKDCMYPPGLFEPWQTLSSHIGAASTR